VQQNESTKHLMHTIPVPKKCGWTTGWRTHIDRIRIIIIIIIGRHKVLQQATWHACGYTKAINQ